MAELPGGGFWGRVERFSRGALAEGKLIRLDTEEFVIEESGARFLLRQARNLGRKLEEAGPGKVADPFLPYDPDLFVAEAAPSHVVLLNKFNVLDQHLLVVTRHFERQETLLSLADFKALCRCLAGRESLGFYNSGPVAGASQPHKHLQVVPLPMSTRTAPLPIGPLLDRPGALPFRLAQRPVRFGADSAAWAAEVETAYRETLAELGLGIGADGGVDGAYNLLLTRDRLLLVPRSRERFHSISVNALGFAGSLFVKTAEELQLVREAGPLRVLREVGCCAAPAGPPQADANHPDTHV